jgi:hypothetical protein
MTSEVIAGGRTETNMWTDVEISPYISKIDPHGTVRICPVRKGGDLKIAIVPTFLFK